MGNQSVATTSPQPLASAQLSSLPQSESAGTTVLSPQAQSADPFAGASLSAVPSQAQSPSVAAPSPQPAPESQSWFSRWGENFRQIGAFIGRAASAATEFVTSIPERASAVVTKVVETLRDGQMWSDIGSNLMRIGRDLTSLENWKSGITWLATGAANLASRAWEALKDPQTWIDAKDWIVKAAGNVKDFAVECIKDPSKILEAGKTVATAIYNFTEKIGLNGLIEGAGRLAAAPFQCLYSLGSNGLALLTGKQDFNQFIENVGQTVSDTFGKGVQALQKGATLAKYAVLAAGELTGITDLVMTGVCLWRGDYKMAALHAAFAVASIGSIAATIATGGAAIGAVAAVATGRMAFMQAVKQVAKVALKSIAKEGLETLAKEAGTEVVQKITKELGEDVFRAEVVKMSHAVVERGVTELAQEVAQKGSKALVGEQALANVRESFAKIAYEQTTQLLENSKVYDKVKETCTELLKKLDNRSTAGLQESLVKAGMSPEAAQKSAKALHQAFKRAASDDEMIEILTKGITKEVTEAILKDMEQPFRLAFECALRGELRTEGGQKLARELAELEQKTGFKLSDKQINELVDAGWDGCREGVERAVREVVERAVKDAFKEFRKNRRHHHGSHQDQSDNMREGLHSTHSADLVVSGTGGNDGHTIHADLKGAHTLKTTKVKNTTLLGVDNEETSETKVA